MCLYIWLNKYEYKMESSVFRRTCKELGSRHTILTRKTAEQTEIQRFLDPSEIAVTGKTAQWYVLLAIAFPQGTLFYQSLNSFGHQNLVGLEEEKYPNPDSSRLLVLPMWENGEVPVKVTAPSHKLTERVRSNCRSTDFLLLPHHTKTSTGLQYNNMRLPLKELQGTDLF